MPHITRYQDFELRLDGNRIHAEQHPTYRRPLTSRMVRDAMVALVDINPANATEAQVRSYGKKLRELVFRGKVKAGWAEALSEQEETAGTGLRLVIISKDLEISEKRWEALFGEGFWALNPGTPVVRGIVDGNRIRAVDLSRLRLPMPMLVVRSDPRGDMQARSREALDGLEASGAAEVTWLGFDLSRHPRGVTREELRRALQQEDKRFQVVHLIAQGAIGQVTFSRDDGTEETVSSDAFARLFKNSGVTLVILECSHGADADPLHANVRSLAAELVRGGVPAVLAFRGDLKGIENAAFMKVLYGSWLSQRCAFEEALSRAREESLGLARAHGHAGHDWTRAVLFVYPTVVLTPAEGTASSGVDRREASAETASPKVTRVTPPPEPPPGAPLPAAPPPPEWAADWGFDASGFWIAIEVESIRYRLRWIPSGQFAMGSPVSEEGRFADDGPQHEVRLTRGFWLGATPVTQSLWQAVMGESPSSFKGPDRPVESVSWAACQSFCARINERTPGLSARLPTEAEWEYACRAGTTTSTYVGDASEAELDPIAWWRGNSGRQTHDVGSKQPNAWGLYDMLGNVWEWCSDWFGAYSTEKVVDPPGPTEGSGRVYRGGGWDGLVRGCRAASRDGWDPSGGSSDLGFRFAVGAPDLPLTEEG